MLHMAPRIPRLYCLLKTSPTLNLTSYIRRRQVLSRSTTSSIVRSSSSSSSTGFTNDTDKNPNDNNVNLNNTETAKTTPTPPLFPWRSSPILLKRLQFPTDLSGTKRTYRWYNQFMCAALVAKQLQYDFLSILFGTWKQELSQDLSWAFQKGVAGVLSHAWKVPMHVIDKEEVGIALDTRSFKLPTANESSSHTDDGDNDDVELEDTLSYIQATLEENLLAKYAPIVFDRSLYDIHFRMRPISSAIEHAFVVPIISRSSVKKEPSLIEDFQMLDDIVVQNIAGYDEVKRHVEALIAKAGNARHTFTLIVDASIECRELFCVTLRSKNDTKNQSEHDNVVNKSNITGTAEEESDDNAVEVLQGSRQEHVVTHLVRFEMELREASKLTTWRITDWDDMLGGNVWHHVLPPK